MTIRNDATRTRIATREQRRPRAVVSRQGQVLLDLDLDQQSRHVLGRLETETVDTLGSSGRLLVPAGNTGFSITPDGANAALNFDIGAGHGYLGGWLLENLAVCKLATQPHPRTGDTLTTPAIIAVKALIRHLDPVEEPTLADAALGDAQASGRALIDWQVFPFNVVVDGEPTLTCADVPSNKAWQDLTAKSTGTLEVAAQTATPSTDPCTLTPSGGYTRFENLLYRFEVHTGDANAAFPSVDGPRFNLDNLKLKFSRRNASLMVRIDKIDSASLTVSPPALDPRNWFAPGLFAEIVSVHDDVDPRAALANERMFRVLHADDDLVVLDATAAQIAATSATTDGTWFLRLWDAFPDGSGIATVSATGGAKVSADIDIGDGLKISLGTGTFRRGDYWNVAARADGSIDWPQTSGSPDPMPPHGPEVRYAPLAVMTGNSVNPAIEICVIPFGTLSDRELEYRGGDGQSVFTPLTSSMVDLPATVRVAVMRGETPVNGATVRWSFVGPPGGSCHINGSNCDANTSVDITTKSDGLAEVTWSIDAARHLDVHRIQAALLSGTALSKDLPIVFSATFETAAHTGYTPGKCATLTNVNNVQDALDTLCSQVGGQPETLRLSSIILRDVKNDEKQLIQAGLILNGIPDVPFDSFTQDIGFQFVNSSDGTPAKIEFDAPQFDPIVEIELDLPYPTTDQDRLYWARATNGHVNSFFGFQRVRLQGMVRVGADAKGVPELQWQPSDPARRFLESAQLHVWGQRLIDAQLDPFNWPHPAAGNLTCMCRIRLRSALIFAEGAHGRIYLNAEHLGILGGTGAALQLEERDPQRAADLDMFIYLVTNLG
jgi:hypothetical protein